MVTHLGGPDDGAVTTGPPRRRWYGGGLLAVAVVAALVITAAIFFRWGAAAVPGASATPGPTASPEASQLTVGQIYEVLQPSVVSIEAKGGAGRGEPGSATATGTGLVVNADAAILTALHVVQGAQSIEVVFADGTRSEATVEGADPANDIAVLTVTTLPAVVVPAVLGGGLSIGDDVVAIGNPLGLTHSTSAGVVSGLGRSAHAGGVELRELIQFDAAVNPGSSGGPLVNTRGEAVGIVVALANPTEAGTFIGIGFAVPIGTAVGAGDATPPQV